MVFVGGALGAEGLHPGFVAYCYGEGGLWVVIVVLRYGEGFWVVLVFDLEGV